MPVNSILTSSSGLNPDSSWRAQAHRYSVSTYRASVVFGCARVSRTGADGSPTGKVRLYSARVASGLTAASRGPSTIIGSCPKSVIGAEVVWFEQLDGGLARA